MSIHTKIDSVIKEIFKRWGRDVGYPELAYNIRTIDAALVYVLPREIQFNCPGPRPQVSIDIDSIDIRRYA